MFRSVVFAIILLAVSFTGCTDSSPNRTIVTFQIDSDGDDFWVYLYTVPRTKMGNFTIVSSDGNDTASSAYSHQKKISFDGLTKDSEDFIVFLDKYSSSGKREWIKKLGRSKVEYGARLIVDSSDNIYVTGFSNLSGSHKILLEKYNTSGIREWTNTLDSTLIDFTWDVTVDSEDNIYTIGFSEKSFKQNISWQDVILHMRFNSDGIKL